MAFHLSDEQRELQRTFHDFLSARFPIESVGAIADGKTDPTLWKELAEMGVFQLRRSEANGGLGLSHVDAARVFEELGKALVPGPTLWTHLVADLVDGAAAGDTIVTGIDLTTNRHTPLVLESLGAANVVVVLRESGLWRVDASAIESESIEPPLDPLTPVDHVLTLPEGERIADATSARALGQVGTMLASAMMVGIAEATSNRGVAYAGEREQFNRPIGSFQAIKHMLADTFVQRELARAAVYAAAGTLDHPEVGSVETAVSEAKLIAGEAAMKNARTCVQVHGGMGYTWEVPVHYFLKRTWVLESSFGTTSEHADRLGATFEKPTST